MRWILALQAAFFWGMAFSTCGAAAESSASVDYLRCEYRVDPLGIDSLQPRLSWEMHDTDRGAKQTAYQILVASTPEKLAADEADLWDSGQVKSDRTSQIEYAGKPLVSQAFCYWKVRIWDKEGDATAYSKAARWSMGLLTPADVRGKWIGVDGPLVHPDNAGSMKVNLDGCAWVWYPEKNAKGGKEAPKGQRFFRKLVAIPADRHVVRGRFLLAVDDTLELSINGQGAGAASGFASAATIDVSTRFVPGKNAIGIAVTNGIDSPAGLLGKLVLELDQGAPIVEIIDASWKSAEASAPQWNLSEFDDSKWQNAKTVAKIGDAPWGKTQVNASPVQGAAMFRKDFKLDQPVRRATLYASALGDFVFYLNGQRVGNDYFSPGWTDYNKRVYYNTYDVTQLVKGQEANAIGGVLAAGWYSGAIAWKSERMNYGGQPRLFGQLEIELADGKTVTVATDNTWKTAWGPYVEGEFLNGETYDARKEQPGWDRAGFDEQKWQPVVVSDASKGKLEAQPNDLVEEIGTAKTQKITEPKPGVYVVDLGQNFAGVMRMKVNGPKGTRVTLRYAEMLNPNGTIYTTNLRGARSTDAYVLKGEGDEVYQPRFTFHGFRYVELTGFPGKPTDDTVTGVVLSSATPVVGAFECSSPMVNQLYANTVRTQRSNYISLPTDCPQRDERLGWTGDAEVFVRAATYNTDVAAFFTKWLVDLEDAQQPDGAVTDVAPFLASIGVGSGTAAWADAGTICPWTIYHVYNDKRLLAKHYGMMTRLVEYDRKNSKDLLRPDVGYGDWLSINAETPRDVIGTAFFAFSAKLTAQAAEALGKTEDAAKYEKLFDDIKAAFNKAYVDKDGRIKGNTQTCYVMALYIGLLPPEKTQTAVKYLVDDIHAKGDHLSTGFIGTGMLMPTLARYGQHALACKLLLNDTYPSWGYSIKHGATSIWERWDGWTAEKGFQDPGMNSFAHYSFGAVARWMFQSLAGIDTQGPGFKQLRIRPQPGEGISSVKASYHSLHGVIATSWKTDEKGFQFDVAIPANTVALVYVPAASPKHVSEGTLPASDAKGVKFVRAEPGVAVFEVGSGEYHFVVQP
jgi:alpha-L-rhamnosidase